MALIKCPDCGNQISDRASHCLNCGCPIEQPQIQRKKCPECGQDVEASIKVCPNCAFPFTKEEKIRTVFDTDNNIRKGRLIIEVDNPVIPLMVSISIKIAGEKVVECKKGDIVELPIEKDCEVVFKWNMAFTSVSLFAKANEVKRVFVEFGNNLLFYEEVLEQIDTFKNSNEKLKYADEPQEAIQRAYNLKKIGNNNRISEIFYAILWIVIVVIVSVTIPSINLPSLLSSCSGSSDDNINVESQKPKGFATKEEVLQVIKNKSFTTDFGTVYCGGDWYVYSGSERVGSVIIEEINSNNALIKLNLDAGVAMIGVRYKVFLDGSYTRLYD